MILILYVTKNITSKYIKQKLTDLKLNLQSCGRHTCFKILVNSQEISKNTDGLNKVTNKLDLIDRQRMLYPAKM